MKRITPYNYNSEKYSCCGDQIIAEAVSLKELLEIHHYPRHYGNQYNIKKYHERLLHFQSKLKSNQC